MALITCPACERARILEPAPRGRFRCTNCGAGPAIVIRRRKFWHDWSERPGLERPEAWRAAWSQLLWYALERRFKLPGWPRHKFFALLKAWPDDSIETAPPAPLRHWLLKWLERQNAKHAAEMRKQGKDRNHGRQS